MLISSNITLLYISYSEYKYIEANSNSDAPKNTQNVASRKSPLEKNEGVKIFSHSKKCNEGTEIKQVGTKKKASTRPDILEDLRKVSYWYAVIRIHLSKKVNLQNTLKLYKTEVNHRVL